MQDASTTRAFTRAISSWFHAHARGLPWRTPTRDAYLALVSEAMLQQTQVSRVLEKFAPFIARFPDVAALAAANEHDVLALWSGLGYYRRARLLHAAAKKVVAEFAGRIPDRAAELLSLPGIGRYTAGAIASIVHNHPEPIVDGNVTRVLLRIHAKDAAPDDKQTIAWVWERAGELVRAAHEREEAGAFNEGLMELGAMVCTPQSPRCDRCPVRARCAAFASGRQDEIPRPKIKSARRNVFHAAVLVRDGHERLLVERRSDHGLWAGLWQPPTVERDDRPATRADIAGALGVTRVSKFESFVHLTTHRTVHFDVWRAAPRKHEKASTRDAGRCWASSDQIAALPLSNPHRRILTGL